MLLGVVTVQSKKKKTKQNLLILILPSLDFCGYCLFCGTLCFVPIGIYLHKLEYIIKLGKYLIYVYFIKFNYQSCTWEIPSLILGKTYICKRVLLSLVKKITSY